MAALYLQPSDYVAYGVPDATEPQVLQASEIINGYLNKPAGLLYQVDGSNNPTVMVETQEPIQEIGHSNLQGRFLLSYKPVVALISVSYNQLRNGMPSFVTTLGSYFLPNGQVWFPPSIAGRAEVIVNYIAGWTYDTLPAAIKQACANIINLNDSDNTVSGPIINERAGDSQIQYANANGEIALQFYANEATMTLLAPFRRMFA